MDTDHLPDKAMEKPRPVLVVLGQKSKGDIMADIRHFM
jgi:hypothetical protein